MKSGLVTPDDSCFALIYDVVLPHPEISEPGPKQEYVAIVNTKRKEILVQSPESCRDFTKQSFMSLLDFAESIGCTTVYMAVPKDSEDLNCLVKGFLYVGFEVVNPQVRKMEGYVLLGCQL